MNQVAETLGARLRAERERKGMSAQKAADDLHLDGWVIDALEGDDYASIGPAVYGKGHLKRYAGLLGLPISDILAAYDTRSAVPTAVVGIHASTLRMRASDDAGPDLPWALIGVAAALVLLVAGTVFWFRPWTWTWTSNAAPPPAAAAFVPAPSGTAEATSSPSTLVAVNQPSMDVVVGLPTPRVAFAATAPGEVAAPTSDTGSVQGLGKARLRLSFSADSWVDVHDAAGRRLFAGSGRANSVKTIAGEAPLTVYLGFASGVQVEVNSRVVAIGPQFVTGDVARFDAGADGVLRRDAHASVAANPRPRG